MKKSIISIIALMPMLCFGREAVSAASSSFSIFMFLLGLAICLIIFLALRKLFLWYWKVDVLIRKQDEQTRLLTSIYNSIEENNRLTQAQIELVIGRD